jgi:hypothetical protein
MRGTLVPEIKGVRVYPPPPVGFDAAKATKKELLRHGIPQRPDPKRQPGLAAVWDRHVRRTATSNTSRRSSSRATRRSTRSR